RRSTAPSATASCRGQHRPPRPRSPASGGMPACRCRHVPPAVRCPGPSRPGWQCTARGTSSRRCDRCRTGCGCGCGRLPARTPTPRSSQAQLGTPSKFLPTAGPMCSSSRTGRDERRTAATLHRYDGGGPGGEPAGGQGTGDNGQQEEVMTASSARRPTIRDVAETAGVSRSTVSRALSGRGYVAPAVRERVQEAAHQLGYVPDITARFLKQQTSRSIGVLVWDVRNSFYAELASGISMQSRAHGYSIILADELTAPEPKTAIAERFVAMRVAGVILTPTNPDLTAYLVERNVPVVEVDRQF